MAKEYTIYKYELKEDFNTINLPNDHKVLHVGLQQDRVYVWIMIDQKDTELLEVNFRMVGTGWKLDPKLIANFRYQGTVHQGAYVWHIFHDGNK